MDVKRGSLLLPTLAYASAAFGLGFLLGTIRVLTIAPVIGGFEASLAEIPIMLAACWLICGWVLRRWPVAPTASARLGMGMGALVLLLAAEVALGLYGFGRSWTGQLAAFAAPEGVAGLAAQGIFALLPLLRR